MICKNGFVKDKYGSWINLCYVTDINISRVSVDPKGNHYTGDYRIYVNIIDCEEPILVADGFVSKDAAQKELDHCIHNIFNNREVKDEI